MYYHEIIQEMYREAFTALKDSLDHELELVTLFDGRWEKQREQSRNYCDLCNMIISQM